MAESVRCVREHGKRARAPLAAFFNIPKFALHARLQTEGQAGGACVVWNQVVQPPTEAMADQVKDWPCVVWPRQIPWDAVWGGLMTGGQLPKGAGDELRAVAGGNRA